MKKTLLMTVAALLAAFSAGAQAPDEQHERLDSTVVSATRAGKTTPVTFTMVGKEDLSKATPSASLPMALDGLPSVVTANEGGTGLGNSKIWIRGSKGSQINVTLNGITLNDAESQEVFWVNIPALTSILSSVQVQRGLGTSASGSGAFGASINMNTAFVGQDPFANFELSGGSYNTFTTVLSAGTGLTESGFYGSAAYSRGYTDGYIRNAKARVQSAFAVLGWMRGRNSVRLTWLLGDQHTGITWNGIDLDQYAKDRRYNDAGEYYDAAGNVHYYDNQTDNYTQSHLQLNYTHRFPVNLTWSTTLNYTMGKGYDEYYKQGRKFAKYGFPAVVEGEKKTDLIYRKSMANGLWVLSSDLRYRSRRLDVTSGVSLSQYTGDHFGEILWSSVLGDGLDYTPLNRPDPLNGWYFNRGVKREISAFARAEVLVAKWLTAYADLQFRGVGLRMSGVDDEDNADMTFKTFWPFFNPRAGLTASWADAHKAYASVAWGHREPSRSDIKEVIESNNLGGADREELRPEKMLDVEIGYQFSGKKVSAGINLYAMEYFDMLLETGRLSSSGYPVKDNVARGWRRGIELTGAYMPWKWLRLDANVTLSVNRIAAYDDSAACIDNDWNELGYSQVYPGGHFDRTTMLLSPSVIAGGALSVRPFDALLKNPGPELRLTGKYVGKQYLDNTSSEDRTVPAYFVANLSLTQQFSVGRRDLSRRPVLGIGAYVDNLFNHLYYADGGAWKYYNIDSGEVVSGVYIYPQAPIHGMVKVWFRW